jgi:DNA-binding PadR family transcriptional regulator
VTPQERDNAYSLDVVRMRLRFLILSLLAIKPSHGYELSKTIEEVTLGTVKASPGSLYPMLRELSEEGLIEEEVSIESGRLRKTYKLTEKGWETLAARLESAVILCRQWGEFLETAWRLARERVGEGCIPGEVIDGLSRLEENVRRLREVLEKRRCQG